MKPALPNVWWVRDPVVGQPRPRRDPRDRHPVTRVRELRTAGEVDAVLPEHRGRRVEAVPAVWVLELVGRPRDRGDRRPDQHELVVRSVWSSSRGSVPPKPITRTLVSMTRTSSEANSAKGWSPQATRQRFTAASSLGFRVRVPYSLSYSALSAPWARAMRSSTLEPHRYARTKPYSGRSAWMYRVSLVYRR